jgi:type 1 glutamine amidotransferase
MYDTMMRLTWLCVYALLTVLLLGCTAVDAAPATTPPHDFAVLVFSKTAGFRHASIQDGIVMIEMLGATHNFSVEASEDANLFNDTDLAEYDVIVFLNTTGDILDETQQAAFEKFIQNGGGFVGIHSATDTEYE